MIKTPPKSLPTSFNAVGRRKNATARVVLTAGEGKITVNGKPFDTYFGRAVLQMVVVRPLEVVSKKDSFNVNVLASGGGPTGQAGATRLGIARALVKFDETFRKLLRAEGLMTRDQRSVERKKYGRHKARRSTQFSKR